MSLEVIVRTVKRYYCPYCGKGYMRKRAAEEHVQECPKDPETCACQTCYHDCEFPLFKHCPDWMARR
jgi:hypothetical protein